MSQPPPALDTRRAKPEATIIIPCYKDAERLEENTAAIESVMNKSGWPYEIIFVEDGGGDGSVDIIGRLVSERENRRAIFHEKNMGRGAAVADGIRKARGSVAGFIDIDLEVSAEYIPTALWHMRDHGCDVVVGRREYRVGASVSDAARHVSSSVYRWLSHLLLPVPVSDSEAGLKFFRCERIKPVLDMAHDRGWFWDTEIVVLSGLAGLEMCEIDCLYERRPDKGSTVRLARDSLVHLVSLMRLRKRIAGRI